MRVGHIRSARHSLVSGDCDRSSAGTLYGRDPAERKSSTSASRLKIRAGAKSWSAIGCQSGPDIPRMAPMHRARHLSKMPRSPRDRRHALSSAAPSSINSSLAATTTSSSCAPRFWHAVRPRVDEIQCDRNDIAAVGAALDGALFDFIYDNVFDWSRGTSAEQVSAAATANVKGLRRYVFTSSVAAYDPGAGVRDENARWRNRTTRTAMA